MITVQEAEQLCWEKAIQIFNEELADKEEKIIRFNSPEAVEHDFQGLNEMKSVAEQALGRCTPSSRPAFVLLKDTLVAIDKYAPVIDVMIQQQPFIVNLVWGGIRFIISASVRASEAGTQIASELKSLIQAIPRYQLELRTYWYSAAVSDAISTALAQVICYIRKAEFFLAKSKLKRGIQAAFSPKLNQILLQSEKADQALGAVIRAAQGKGTFPALLVRTNQLIRMGRQGQADFFRQAEFEIARQGILLNSHEEAISRANDKLDATAQMLSDSPLCNERARVDICNDLSDPATCLLWLEKGVSKTIVPYVQSPGTCEWIFACPEYKAWLASGCQQLLWLQGEQGCGKTTLATYLVENASTSIVLVHYFGNSKHPGLGATTRFATTLLARLFHEKSLKRDRRFDCVVQRILKLATRYDSGVESPRERLLDILDQVFELLSDFTLVVDALDECTKPEVCGAAELYCLISYLKRLASGNKGRVIILSRTATLSEEDFSDTHRISMDGDIVKHDIMCYVNEEIRQYRRRNSGLEELKDEILAKVSKDCQGTFLWAKYVMDELKTTTTTNGIRARLNEFPAKVVDFYRRELKEGNGRLHELERIQRHDTLSLVAGTLEPLYVRDIAEMLALDTGTNEIEKGNLLANPAVDVPRICCPFLTVMKDQVQFVHEAAESAVRDFEVTRKASDALLAMKCLSKLSQSEYVEWSCPARLLRRNLRATGDIDDDSERSFKESVTYRYACLYWQKHVTALKDPSNEILVKLAEFFGSNAFVTWSETLLLLKPNSGVGAHVQIRTLLQGWLDTIPPDRQRKIPIESFFVKPHEQLKDEFNDKAGDRILPYLPLVRLGQYFNVGGRNNQDHWRAYRYKMVVAAGFEDVLGHRHPLTLRARTEVYKEYFYQKRFDEAERGLTEIVEAQREVIGEDDIDYYFTLQLLGSVQLCLADFERSIATLGEAADGFRRLSGKDYLYTLQTEFYIGLALERTPRLVEADDIYERLLQVFVPDGGASHPFSLMLKTARGSVLRKLGRYVEAENVLTESFNARKALFTNEDVITIDSALQLAALFYERERESEGTKYLDFVSRTEIVKDEFERHCQEQHIRALVAFGTGSFSEPIAALRRLLSTVSGDGRDKNNRELQWARITLADALRQAGNDDEALIVFSDLVTPLADEYVPSSEVEETEQLAKFPFTLAAEPESRRQLELAEKALRLAKAAEPEKAELLLRDNGLKWLRKADFWALAGGPITDTASMSGLDAEDYVIIDLSTTMGAGNPLPR